MVKRFDHSPTGSVETDQHGEFVLASDYDARVASHEREVKAHQVQCDVLRDQIRELGELRDRAYMRLQCADVPRDPWHWEVSTMLVTPDTALEPLRDREA